MNTEQVSPQNLKPGDVVLGVGNNENRRVRQVGDRDVRWNELEIIFEDNSRVWYRYDQLITVQTPRTSP